MYENHEIILLCLLENERNLFRCIRELLLSVRGGEEAKPLDVSISGCSSSQLCAQP